MKYAFLLVFVICFNFLFFVILYPYVVFNSLITDKFLSFPTPGIHNLTYAIPFESTFSSSLGSKSKVFLYNVFLLLLRKELIVSMSNNSQSSSLYLINKSESIYNPPTILPVSFFVFV